LKSIPALAKLSHFFDAWVPDWVLAIGIFAAIMVVGLAAQRWITRVLARRPADWHPFFRHAWGSMRLLLRFILLLFALRAALPLVHLPREVADNVSRLFLALFIVELGWMAMAFANIAMDRYVFGLNLNAADNLLARKTATQLRVLRHAINVLIGLFTAGFALMSFDSVRQFGISLFASAGVAGIVAGLAARPLFENLIAGLQLAFTQPLRMGDVVVIDGEWGTVEEINSIYIVIKIWDLRRQIVPLSYIFTNPFTNWTRSSSSILGSAVLYLDYTMDVAVLRTEAERLVKTSPLWDQQVISTQVIDTTEYAMQVRVLISAANSGDAWGLRCFMRENLIAFVRDHYPASLPRRRQDGTVRTPDLSVIETHGSAPPPN
jgi:small-conductance mechanosensitive channel